MREYDRKKRDKTREINENDFLHAEMAERFVNYEKETQQ